MQSEYFSFRKTFREIFHTSSSGDRPDSATLNPSLSEPIGEGGGVVMSTIETSLAALKEASSLAANIHYIAPIAGLLLQVLTMRDVSVHLLSRPSSTSTFFFEQEVKQHKEEWDIVMRKLARVAGLVVNVGESCQKYDLKESDLPPGLRTILQSLQSYVFIRDIILYY
ncbi:hypothetical protein B0F90DRAFT_897521 [Multifurca ochricompacta]|uniref:Uncharacterized protein n=1 Tax=Multifurca ochricompacta TaxID=376703 RepID=A0AAD4QJ87_9AGAM|nr:hypothetical protein B0F90DRAFT_897521 [Multifurca ochricompacta]